MGLFSAFYPITRRLVLFAVRVFYPKLQVIGRERLITEGPLLLVANHPNTMMDPIVIASITKQRIGFIAMSLIFANKMAAWFFTKLHVIPVYRQQDAKPGEIRDNSAMFSKCLEYLNNKGTILIFPEGITVQEFKLRQVKTGAGRIAMEFEKMHDYKGGLHIQPIGLTYFDATRFGTRLQVNIGEPIHVSTVISADKYKDSYKEDDRPAVTLITEYLKIQIEDLMVLSDHPEDEQLIKWLRVFHAEFIDKEMNLKSNHLFDFMMTKTLGEMLNEMRKSDMNLHQQISELTREFFEQLEEQGMHIGFFRSEPKRLSMVAALFWNSLFLILLFPAFAAGLITNYLPYRLPYFISKAIIRDVRYRAGSMLVVAIVLFPIYYALQLLIIAQFIDLELWQAMLFVFSAAVFGLFTVPYVKIISISRSIFNFLRLNMLDHERLHSINQKGLKLAALLEQASIRFPRNDERNRWH